MKSRLMLLMPLVLLLVVVPAGAWELDTIYTTPDALFGIEWAEGENNTPDYEVERSLDGAYFVHFVDVTGMRIETTVGDGHTVRFRVRGYMMVDGVREVGPYSDSSAIIIGTSDPAPASPKNLNVTM